MDQRGERVTLLGISVVQSSGALMRSVRRYVYLSGL
jgi:hypothetical protein